MTFWKIGEKPIVKNISVETERCSQTFFVKNMRSWIEESIIVLSEKSLRYGGDTCQYAVLDTVAGTLTFKRLDENLKWIQKCDDVRAWGDDVYCVILDNEGENSLILKNINDTIPTPRKFAIGGFWGNMIKLSGNICSIHDDEITCSDVIWYGNELKFYENGEVVVDLEYSMRKRIVLFLILLIVCESRAVPKPMESLTNYNVLLLHCAYGHTDADGVFQ